MLSALNQDGKRIIFETSLRYVLLHARCDEAIRSNLRCSANHDQGALLALALFNIVSAARTEALHGLLLLLKLKLL